MKTDRGIEQKLFPCGQTRREFVWEMGGGFAGVALTGLLLGEGFFPKASAAEPAKAETPLAPKNAHFAAKAKSVIFLMMNGGPSQVDTFDHKPMLEKLA